eukprot:1155870-Rhodomonas_salina.1
MQRATVMILLISADGWSQVTTFAVNYKGRPYMQSLIEVPPIPCPYQSSTHSLPTSSLIILLLPGTDVRYPTHPRY